jgi:trimeric autotransporter adhesin
MMTIGIIYGQVTYYWIGGIAGTTGINTSTNWNTNIDGSGTSRPSSAGATDILIFDGANLGGTTPVTGPATILATAGITCSQIIFINNANVLMRRPTSGTSAIIVTGGVGEDFVINSGSSLTVNSPFGSVRFTLQTTVDACRVSGALSLISTQQIRFENTIAGSSGIFRFKSGSSFTTNITSATSSYPFGNNTQSSSEWVVFEDGAHLYYLGGWSPNGNTSTFSAIMFMPGSFFHQRAPVFINPVTNAPGGSFFNRKSFGNLLIENSSSVLADGSINRINNFTITSGTSFTTHTSGQTAIMGDLTVDGTLTAVDTSTNEIIVAGNTPQIISGAGTIDIRGLTIGNHANVTLNKNVVLTGNATIFGQINFTDKQLTGVTDFKAKGITAQVVGMGTTKAGSYIITSHTGIATSSRGQKIEGVGIPANTTIVNVSVTDDQIIISNPATESGTAISLTVSSNGATLQNANANGYMPMNGSVVASGIMTFEDDINYIIDAATIVPFGTNTVSTIGSINVGSVTVNATTTVNKSINVKNNLLINSKMTLRPGDTVHILTGGNIIGTFDATKYIATDYATATGVKSILQYDGISSVQTIPLGTINNYLPVTITPTVVSNFSTNVFESITTNGQLSGTPYTALQKLRFVDAVWNIERTSGSGIANIKFNWSQALEGSTFSTLEDTTIGVITNNGSTWSLPIDTGNNITNIASDTTSTFGTFGIGAKLQANAFVFNALLNKTYGDADFIGGATSLNTTESIIYTSSNPQVATIVNGSIHIVGAGTTIITASQASDGVFPAFSKSQPLFINKATLNIIADNKLRFEGLGNPTLTITYNSFVLGETEAILLTPVVISTTATISSAPGTYPITVNGATANNYDITYTSGVLTVQAKQNQTITFNAPIIKNYGNADFAHAATSTNSTIPLVLTSSNTNVAIIVGNLIKITGAGTTTITASQAGNDGYFAAANVVRTLTVNKVNLTIKVNDTIRNFGESNPAFRVTYRGFVLGESASNLTTQPVIATAATIASSPGNYILSAQGTVTQNYNIITQDGRLTILPATGNAEFYVSAYKNASESITVRIYSPAPYLADVVIYDMNGKYLARKNIFMNVGFTSVNVPAQALASGMYVARVIGKGVNLQTIFNYVK